MEAYRRIRAIENPVSGVWPHLLVSAFFKVQRWTPQLVRVAQWGRNAKDEGRCERRSRTWRRSSRWRLVSTLRGRRKDRGGEEGGGEEVMVVGRKVLPLAARFRIRRCSAAVVKKKAK